MVGRKKCRERRDGEREERRKRGKGLMKEREGGKRGEGRGARRDGEREEGRKRGERDDTDTQLEKLKKNILSSLVTREKEGKEGGKKGEGRERGRKEGRRKGGGGREVDVSYPSL